MTLDQSSAWVLAHVAEPQWTVLWPSATGPSGPWSGSRQRLFNFIFIMGMYQRVCSDRINSPTAVSVARQRCVYQTFDINQLRYRPQTRPPAPTWAVWAALYCASLLAPQGGPASLLCLVATMCVCVCARARACVRAWVFVCARVCVCVCVWGGGGGSAKRAHARASVSLPLFSWVHRICRNSYKVATNTLTALCVALAFLF